MLLRTIVPVATSLLLIAASLPGATAEPNSGTGQACLVRAADVSTQCATATITATFRGCEDGWCVYDWALSLAVEGAFVCGEAWGPGGTHVAAFCAFVGGWSQDGPKPASYQQSSQPRIVREVGTVCVWTVDGVEQCSQTSAAEVTVPGSGTATNDIGMLPMIPGVLPCLLEGGVYLDPSSTTTQPAPQSGPAPDPACLTRPAQS